MFRFISRTFLIRPPNEPNGSLALLNHLRQNIVQLTTKQFSSESSYSSIPSAKLNSVDEWIQTLSDAQKEKIRFIQNEITFQELERKTVPQLDKLTISDYVYMLNISNNRRHKHYIYLGSNHRHRSSDNAKKDMRAQLDALYVKENAVEKLREYGLGKNSLIPKLYNKTLDAYKNRNVARQMILNAPKMIFDLGFDKEMSPRENLETARQLNIIIANNRRHRVPFVLHFCNIAHENVIWRHLHRMMPTIERLPMNLNREDYTDILPNDKLVILTPDSPNVLEKYDANDHYVISALVDRGDMKPLSLSKAKQKNLRTARLPLDSYRSVRQNKVLTLDQIHNVMLEVKYSNDWNKAFEYIAARKFK